MKYYWPSFNQVNKSVAIYKGKYMHKGKDTNKDRTI